MSIAMVKPGVCGMDTTITVHKKDGGLLDIQIETKCPHVKKIGEDLKEIDGMDECFSKFSASAVYEAADKYCRHLACPMPSAIIKAIEVESGLALPRNVEMVITKE
jgi:hypothetical protein